MRGLSLLCSPFASTFLFDQPHYRRELRMIEGHLACRENTSGVGLPTLQLMGQH